MGVGGEETGEKIVAKRGEGRRGGIETGEAKLIFFLMIRRPQRSTQGRSSAASDVYRRRV